jgi:hypothetical protein
MLVTTIMITFLKHRSRENIGVVLPYERNKNNYISEKSHIKMSHDMLDVLYKFLQCHNIPPEQQ